MGLAPLLAEYIDKFKLSRLSLWGVPTLTKPSQSEMRCAILLVAFALLSSASASFHAASRIRELARAARRAQAGSSVEVSVECSQALAGVVSCPVTAWGVPADSCCAAMTSAYAACDVDVQGMASLLLTYVPSEFSSFQASDFGFDVMARCPGACPSSPPWVMPIAALNYRLMLCCWRSPQRE